MLGQGMEFPFEVGEREIRRIEGAEPRGEIRRRRSDGRDPFRSVECQGATECGSKGREIDTAVNNKCDAITDRHANFPAAEPFRLQLPTKPIGKRFGSNAHRVTANRRLDVS